METDLSLFSLVANASVLVQLVMALLLIVSILSWAIIFQKYKMLKLAAQAADDFEDKFWSGGCHNRKQSICVDDSKRTNRAQRITDR